MPVLDVQLVLRDAAAMQDGLAGAIANAAAMIFGSAPGHVWVRLSVLAAECYAENDVSTTDLQQPVFVTVLHALLPEGPALRAEAQALSSAVAEVIGCSSELVHIEYAPQGLGRVAFGGRLVQ